jgi:hypothetical protein
LTGLFDKDEKYIFIDILFFASTIKNGGVVLCDKLGKEYSISQCVDYILEVDE